MYDCYCASIAKEERRRQKDSVENFISGPYRKAILSVSRYILVMKLPEQKYLLQS